MKQWHANLKTTLLPETPPALISQLNRENTDGSPEDQLRRLIGQMLTQTSLLCAYADFLRSASQFNSHTPVMVEAMSFALWAMENHLTNTCAQAKALTPICKRSQMTTPNDMSVDDLIAACELIMEDVNLFFFG